MRARLSTQGFELMPNRFVIKEQLRTELAGLFAGVGYSAVVIGTTSFTTSELCSFARSKIFSAKPCQVVTPLPQ
jgi:hypothetical protein